MSTSRKRSTVPETPALPQVGDKVRPGSSEMVYEIDHVIRTAAKFNLYVPGTNLKRFRVRTETLTFVERKTPAKTSNPFTQPEPPLMLPKSLSVSLLSSVRTFSG